MRPRDLARAARSAAWVLLLGLMLFYPDRVVQGAQEGLQCCAGQLVPALYPLLVVCPLVVGSPAAGALGLVFRPYLRLLGVRAPQAGAALLMGLLGGFAPAARCLGDLCRRGTLQPWEAQLLLIAAAGAGPGFVVNSVGLLMLGSARLGWLLLGCQAAAGLVCGAVAAGCLRKGTALLPTPPGETPAGREAHLTDAAREGATAMLALCGTVVFFRCLYRLILPIFPSSPALQAGAAALLEVTGGCLAAARLPGHAAPYGCCVALSLLGGSVLLQLRALLPREVSLRPLLFSRLLHLPVSLALLHTGLRLLPDVPMPAAASAAPTLLVQTRARPDAALLLFAVCCLALWRLQRTGRPALQPGGEGL